LDGLFNRSSSLHCNTVNIGANLAAMGSTLQLLLGGPLLLYTKGIAALSVLLQITFVRGLCTYVAVANAQSIRLRRGRLFGTRSMGHCRLSASGSDN
jgi:hypothetical protein